MKERRQSVNFDNLQETIDASTNTMDKGTQQFETPPEIASALMVPLPIKRPVVCDFNCGHGNLLGAAYTSETEYLLGVDIDPTLKIPKCGDEELKRVSVNGDITLVYPFMREVSAKFDLLVLNPPFSLRWHTERLAGLGESDRHYVSDAYRVLGNKDTIDSTLATYLMALDRLTTYGEGLMICNANTARRFLGDPEETDQINGDKRLRDFAHKVWLWVELPDFFSGTVSDTTIGVLYFASDHKPSPGYKPTVLKIKGNTPDEIRNALAPYANLRKSLIQGRTVDKLGYVDPRTSERFEAVADEWRRRKDEEKGERNGFNIFMQGNGTLGRYLTPFQSFSGNVPRDLVMDLNALHNKRPAELVVMKSTRVALHRAVHGGVWRVQPEVLAVVDGAIKEYNSVRAPFIALNPVQRLGYLDEEDNILCQREGLAGFKTGVRYELRTQTIEGRKVEKRKRIDGKDEEVEVAGQELLIEIVDEEKKIHCFTQLEMEKRYGVDFYHTLLELVENFNIPDVPDVAECQPELFNNYRESLLALEWA